MYDRLDARKNEGQNEAIGNNTRCSIPSENTVRFIPDSCFGRLYFSSQEFISMIVWERLLYRYMNRFWRQLSYWSLLRKKLSHS